jgi:hypothetical protein
VAEILNDRGGVIARGQQCGHPAGGRRPEVPLCLLGNIPGDLRETIFFGRGYRSKPRAVAGPHDGHECRDILAPARHMLDRRGRIGS